MGRDLHWVPGSFYRVDDRTGFPTRANRTRMQWNNLIVDERFWDPRQQQDLVRGVPDYQAVAYPRPLAPNSFVGPLYFELTQAAEIGTWIVYLASIAGITEGDPFGVVLDFDNGAIFRTIVTYVGNGYVVLGGPMPNYASSGNLAIDYRPGTNEPQISPLLDANGFPLLDANGNPLFPG